MSEIQARGRLVVGVSSDTLLLGARNPDTNQFQGFDIEMAKQIAKAIFGDEKKIQFKAISAGQRIPSSTRARAPRRTPSQVSTSSPAP